MFTLEEIGEREDVVEGVFIRGALPNYRAATRGRRRGGRGISDTARFGLAIL